jgi:uncharacterized LabA/DUF88 family protein
MIEEVIIFVDGAYLSYISKFFGNGKHLKFKIENFCCKIAGENGLICKEIFYYTAPPFQEQNEKSNERKANYDKFIQKLKRANLKITIREGRCQKINSDFSQKGVDTLITMDLLKQAQLKKTRNFLLISADTDFVPIIKDIQENNKINVILAYFTDLKRKSPFSLSNHLWVCCKQKILITKNHFTDNGHSA